MTAWSATQLDRLAAAEEIDLESERADGTLRAPVTMWMVRAGDCLYVRSVKGREGPWFVGTQTCHRGRVRAGGVVEDVGFETPDPGVRAAVDAAYRAKYGTRYLKIVDDVLTERAREATLQLVPR